jgi:hypothetical protein
VGHPEAEQPAWFVQDPHVLAHPPTHVPSVRWHCLTHCALSQPRAHAAS